MKKFARLDYDNFIINGEVNERLPQYNEDIYEMLPLDGNVSSIFPTYKIEAANVTIGDPSIILSKSNIAITDNIMRFTGDNDSYIQLSSNIMNSSKLEIEFYFKANSFTNDLILFSSDDLTIKIDAANKYIYALMPNLTGEHTPKNDLPNGGFRLTANNTIILNKMHRLKIIKYESIVRVYFETNRVKSMVCENGFNATNSYLGRGFKGEIKEMNITHPTDNNFENATISLPQTYTIMFTFNTTKSEKKTIFQMGNFSITQDLDTVRILNTSLSDIYTNFFPIDLGMDYLIFISFENNVASLQACHTGFGYVMIDDSFRCDTNGYFHLATNCCKNATVYNKVLNSDLIYDICKKKFRLKKDGNILYEIDETNGNERLVLYAGRKYHLQLTRDLNSDCGFIKNIADVNFVDGGVESSSSDKKIKLSFVRAIALSSTWDIIYKTKITSLSNNAHYDSLGNGMYWGIDNNKFVINYNNTSSYIEGLKASDVLNEFILMSVSYSSNTIKFLIATSKGIFSTTISQSVSSITGDYDLFLGGKDNTLYGQATYRELTIVNGWIVSDSYKEKYFRTKFSYYNNKLISNVSIVEQVEDL